MTQTYSTTALVGEGSIVRGNVAMVAGAWDMADTNTTSFAIVTGGTDVLAAGVYNATITATPQFALNKNGAGVATNGSLQVKGCNKERSGTWWAIVRTSGTN